MARLILAGGGGGQGPPGPEGPEGPQGPQGEPGEPGGGGLTADQIIDLIYPVGSIIELNIATNPGTLFSRGTWVAHGAGRVTVAINAGDAEFDTVDETGGAKTHTLSAAESGVAVHGHGVTDPGHTHTMPVGATDDTSAPFDRADAGSNASGANATTETGSKVTGLTVNNHAGAAASQAHNNLQPYTVVYRWRRTA